MPCHAHVVTCLSEPMSRLVEPMSWHACLVKPVLVFQAVWLHALSCFQRLPGDKHKSCHAMASPASSIFLCIFQESFVVAFAFYVPCYACRRGHAKPSENALSSPYRGISCARVVACLVPLSWHALSRACQASRLPLSMARHALSGPCYAMPCDVSNGLPGDKHKSCHSMSCLARCHALSCFHLRVMFLAIARWQAQVVPCLA